MRPSTWGLKEKSGTKKRVQRIVGKVVLWLGLAVLIYILGLTIDTLVDARGVGPGPPSHRGHLSSR